MALIAAIVVVTNTTLVSVTQRTREIGIRRAVGAARANVLVEVLAESSVVALVGGVAGLAIAAGVLSLASRALSMRSRARVDDDGRQPRRGGGVSGVVAGWYPARRAAALDVITALRQE